MDDQPGWGRSRKAKQQRLPGMASDRCGGIDWDRHPAWTESMRAALQERQATGGKWFSLIDRMWDPRLLRKAWARLHAQLP